MRNSGERMKQSKMVPALFAAMGILLAAITVLLCFRSLNAEPVLLKQSQGARECAEGLMAKICAGDYAGASLYLYGKPTLDSGVQRESETGEAIWNAFTASMEYELIGDSFASQTGVAQKVRLRSLQIPTVTAKLKDRSASLLESRVAAAEDMSAVYDEQHQYREDFVLSVLRDAAAQAIAEDGITQDQELVLNLVFEKGQWWVMPDQSLFNAISGGILG